jgi:hypothetical protein
MATQTDPTAPAASPRKGGAHGPVNEPSVFLKEGSPVRVRQRALCEGPACVFFRFRG